MTLVRSLFVVIALLVSTSAFASDTESAEPMHGRSWQCQAHSHHGDWEIFTGGVYLDKHQAEHSAIQTCEYNSGDECRLHRCRRVSYNSGSNY